MHVLLVERSLGQRPPYGLLRYRNRTFRIPYTTSFEDEVIGILEDIRDLPHKNLALELLRKLLNDEIGRVRRTNIVQARLFSDLLDAAIAKYTNRSLTTAEIIAEMVELAKHMRDAHQRAEQLGLSESEVAFYDAVVQNDSAVLQMGDETLKKIAMELVKAVRESATIDWNLKENVRASMRAKIKRLLTKYDYPPDKEERAIDLASEVEVVDYERVVDLLMEEHEKVVCI